MTDLEAYRQELIHLTKERDAWRARAEMAEARTWPHGVETWNRLMGERDAAVKRAEAAEAKVGTADECAVLFGLLEQRENEARDDRRLIRSLMAERKLVDQLAATLRQGTSIAEILGAIIAHEKAHR